MVEETKQANAPDRLQAMPLHRGDQRVSALCFPHPFHRFQPSHTDPWKRSWKKGWSLFLFSVTLRTAEISSESTSGNRCASHFFKEVPYGYEHAQKRIAPPSHCS